MSAVPPPLLEHIDINDIPEHTMKGNYKASIVDGGETIPVISVIEPVGDIKHAMEHLYYDFPTSPAPYFHMDIFVDENNMFFMNITADSPPNYVITNKDKSAILLFLGSCAFNMDLKNRLKGSGYFHVQIVPENATGTVTMTDPEFYNRAINQRTSIHREGDTLVTAIYRTHSKGDVKPQKYVYGTELMSFPFPKPPNVQSSLDIPYKHIVDKLTDITSKNALNKVTTFRPLVKNLTSVTFVDCIITHSTPIGFDNFNPDYEDMEGEDVIEHGLPYDMPKSELRVLPGKKRKFMKGTIHRGFNGISWDYREGTFEWKKEPNTSIDLNSIPGTMSESDMTCTSENFHDLTMRMCEEDFPNMGGGGGRRRRVSRSKRRTHKRRRSSSHKRKTRSARYRSVRRRR
jgi:hypothetical protein